MKKKAKSSRFFHKIGTKGRRTLDPKRANDILPKSVEE